ncbi:MAG: sugar phosphate isomerase/epimerase [Oscillospiraceae bacterium]|nr:sugar phosphate isomerase/epimerase [Oscillospiraceae bacterium]
MIAIADYFGYDLPYPQRIRLIAEAGFDAVMLWYGDDFGLAFRAENRPAQARACGLRLENVHAPFDEVNHLWEDSADGQRVFEGYLQCVEDCARFGIPTVVVHADRGRTPPPVSALGLERWAALIRRAEALGVNIAVENLRNAHQIDRAQLLLERFDSRRFGFCYDSGHWHARYQDFDWLGRWPQRLMALHLHDNHGGETEGHDDQHLLPFDGTIDWPAQMRAIAETGYPGPTALEIARKTGYKLCRRKRFLALAQERAVKLEELRHA